jgi:hypothetical protein
VLPLQSRGLPGHVSVPGKVQAPLSSTSLGAGQWAGGGPTCASGQDGGPGSGHDHFPEAHDTNPSIFASQAGMGSVEGRDKLESAEHVAPSLTRLAAGLTRGCR